MSRAGSIALVNNKGVVKEPTLPPTVDPSQKALVRIVTPAGVANAREWTDDGDRPVDLRGGEIRLDVPPGDLRIVRLVDDGKQR